MCGQVIMIHDNQTYYQNIFFLNSWPQRMTASEEMKMIAKVLQKSLHHSMTIAMLFNGHHYDDYIGNDESDKKVLSRHNAARQLERGWHPLTFFTLVRAPLEATTMTQSHGITILIVMVVMASMIVNMLPSHQNLQWTGHWLSESHWWLTCCPMMMMMMMTKSQ